MKTIFYASRLLVKHDLHICKLPNSCPDYGKNIFQFKIGDQSTFVREEEIKTLIVALQEHLNGTEI